MASVENYVGCYSWLVDVVGILKSVKLKAIHHRTTTPCTISHYRGSDSGVTWSGKSRTLWLQGLWHLSHSEPTSRVQMWAIQISLNYQLLATVSVRTFLY